MIISNNPKSKGLAFGKIYKIRTKIFNFSKQAKTEKEILELLKKKKINLICLAGFMRILSKNFIQNFKGQILNIHPSLLPKYKGLNTHDRAIKNKDRYSGCTVHFVTAKLDSGKIIIQKKVKINKKDTPRTLANRVLAEEHKLYPEAILKIISL
jgi:phosphoribosylglycinamide formyltransferase-1